MPYLPEFARNRILRGCFLTQDDLTQEQYELITDPKVKVKDVFALYDTLFGGNFSKLYANNPHNLPYLPDDDSPDVIPPDDWPDSEFVDSPEPIRPEFELVGA